MTKKSRGTELVLFFINKNAAVYIDSFRMGYISQAVFHKQNQIKIYKAQRIKNTKWSYFYRIYASRKKLWYIPIYFLVMTVKMMTR